MHTSSFTSSSVDVYPRSIQMREAVFGKDCPEREHMELKGQAQEIFILLHNWHHSEANW